MRGHDSRNNRLAGPTVDGEERLRSASAIANDTLGAQWYVADSAGAIAPSSPLLSPYMDDVSVRLS